MRDQETTREHEAGPKDYKALFRKLDAAIGQIDRIDDPGETVFACLKLLVENFSQDFGFVGGRIYTRSGEDYVLQKLHGESRGATVGYVVPSTYEPVQALLREGVLIMRPEDPGFNPEIEGPIGVSKFAAFSVGEGNAYILSLTIQGPIDEEHILYALSALRHIINAKLRQQHLQNIIEEARRIQLSILPFEPPRFDGFDIYGESIPADLVGGDLFDYIHQSRRLLGIAVADASGHGLPAALQARDVITGMRMGMEENLKIITAIERLNRVIHKGRLSSRFVSLFYAEIESNGNFIYCNAGHPPGLLMHASGMKELRHGGLVLGPNPEARYERGFAILEPGDRVLLYTDGVTEAAAPDGEEYGLDRLKSTFRSTADLPARESVQAILGDVRAFASNQPQSDDQTMMVVRRL